MKARLLAGEVLGFEYALSFIEDLLLNDWLVLAFVSDASVLDDADVVGVTQHVVERRGGDRPAGTFWCRPAEEAFLGHLDQQRACCPFAACVHLKGLFDERRPFGIDLNRSHLAAFVEQSDRAIADRRPEGRAAALGLLDETFVDFVGEVAAVELGDRTHNSVQQHPARSLVDVLAAGDERYACLGEDEVDLDVVDSIARQPIDFMNDTEADGVLGKIGEHPLQLRSPRTSSALAAVNELLDDDGTEGFGFAAAGVTLCRDREAFGFTSTRGLFLG